LTLVLAGWSGVAPARVARLMTIAWSLTLVPPLADFLASHDHDVPTIGYLHADPADLPWIVVHFFDPGARFLGSTTGIRVETAIAVALGALYVALRRGSWWRPVGAAVCVYVFSLFFFTLPLIVLGLFRWVLPNVTRQDFLWGSGMVFRPRPETAPDSISILWLVPVTLGLGGIWALLERSEPGGERWVRGQLGTSALRGAAILPTASLLAGFLAARWIHLPVEGQLVVAPHDFLAPLGACLAVLLGTRSVLAQGARPDLAVLALAFTTAIAAALGRTAAVGLTAMLAPFLVIGTGWLAPGWRGAAAAIATAIASVAGFVTGFGLIIGPEALARAPRALLALPLLAGLAAGVLLVRRTNRILVSTAVAGAAIGVPLLALQHWVLGAIGLVIGALAGAFGHLAENTGSASKRPPWIQLLLGLCVVLMLRGVVATPETREPLREQQTCLPRLSVVRAESHRDAGRVELAETEYRQALRCDEDYVPAMRGLGLLWIEKDNRRSQGIELLERVVAHDPSASDLSNLASAYVKAGRNSEALGLLDRAVAIDPREPSALFNRALVLETLGKTGEAVAAWDAYIDRAHRLPDLSQDLAEAKRRLRQLRPPDKGAPRGDRVPS
ncbi:MAG: tetratricopeptide repeat protein, partial [Acidobacteria bacterium]|nr:tetratricopeptide repeat protein [Acidobacteriota bacterium]